MPKELTNKQLAFVNAIENSTNKTTYNNGLESARAAGYKGNDNTLAVIASQNLTKLNIKQAIEVIRAEKQAKADYDYDTAIASLDKVIANLTKQAENGNIQANQALTGAIREKNAITGLHKQTIQHKGDALPQPTEAQGKALDGFARQYKLKLTQGAG